MTTSSRLAWDVTSSSAEGPLLPGNPLVPGKPGESVTPNPRGSERQTGHGSSEWFLGGAEVEMLVILGLGFGCPLNKSRFPRQKGTETTAP